MTTSRSAVFLTGGHSHPPELSAPAIEDVLGGAGFDRVDVTDDIEHGIARLGESPPDLAVVNSLRWSMPRARDAAHRDEWGFSLSDRGRQTLTDALREGVPLLAMHTALVSFDDWPGWGDLIGGSWNWDRSSHPPVGSVTVVAADDDPVTDGIGSFAVTDECYTDLDMRPGNRVVATMSAAGGPRQPACWLRETASGRVATSALGHDHRSLDDPPHRALIRRLVTWLVHTPPTQDDT